MQTVDLANSETFERGIPHEYFSWLRENEPVHWQPPGTRRVGTEGFLDAEPRGSRFALVHRGAASRLRFGMMP